MLTGLRWFMINSVVYRPLELTFVSIYCCFGCLLTMLVAGVIVYVILVL